MKLFPWLICCFFFILSCKKNNIKYEMEKEFKAGVPQIISIPSELIDKENLSLVVDNRHFPVQKGSEGKYWVLTDSFIPKNTEAYFETSDKDIKQEPISISDTGPNLIATWNGVEILRYAIATRMPPDTVPGYFRRSGFIDPIKSKSGRVITAGFPEGHVHQHGLFNAWRSAHFQGQFIDFWNQAAELGTVIHKEVIHISNGPVFSEFKVALQQIATIQKDTIPALDEVWTIKLFSLRDHWIMDWSIDQQCSGSDTLHLDEYHYGGAAFRGCETWNVHHGAYDSLVYFTTNEGKNHIDGNHTRPKWVAMYGETGQGTAGVAMMGHQRNFRHPQPVRVHPTMPYFVFTPSVLGDFLIAPGEVYSSSYRLLVYDGEPPTEKIDEMMRGF